MKRNSILKGLAYSLCCGWLAASFIGCAGGDSDKSNTSESTTANSTVAASSTDSESTEAQDATTATQVATSSAEPTPAKPATNTRELKGVWYGESVYDVDALNAQLAQMDPEQALKLQEIVNTFSTIVMAAEFRPDSVMEFDMMITTKDGQQLRDRSYGTWAVVEKTKTGLTVETKEYKSEEDTQPTQKVYVYQFIDNDHFQFVPESISPDLRPFSPRIIFQRVEQPLEDAAVAEEQTSKVIR